MPSSAFERSHVLESQLDDPVPEARVNQVVARVPEEGVVAEADVVDVDQGVEAVGVHLEGRQPDDQSQVQPHLRLWSEL